MGQRTTSKRSIRSQDGIAMPVALMSIVSVMLLVSGVATNAGWSQRQTRRDTASKQALDAAEAGIQTAVGRLNRLHPKAGICVLDAPVRKSTSPSATPWCPSQGAPLDGNGESVAFRVTAGTLDNQREIVATGMSQCDTGVDDTSQLCVKRRLAVTVTNTPSSFETDAAAFSSGNLTLRDDQEIHEGVESTPADPTNPRCAPVGSATTPDGYCGARVVVNGDVHIANRAGICGQLTMNMGAIYEHLGTVVEPGCLQKPITAGNVPTAGSSTGPASTPLKDPTPASSRLNRAPTSLTLPDVTLPGNVVANSANCRLTTVTGQAGGCANIGAEPDTWPTPSAGSLWDPAQRALIIKGNDVVTLRGGVYFFCYLEIGDGELQVDTENPGGDPTVIYIGAPGVNCPAATDPMPVKASAGGSWGSVLALGNSSILNVVPVSGSPGTFTVGDPGKLQLMVVGFSGSTDKLSFGARAGHQKLIVYAPHSTIEIGDSSGVTRAIGADLVVGGNFGIEWDDRAAVNLAFAPTKFVRTTWYECPSQLPAGSSFSTLATDPTQGCNPS